MAILTTQIVSLTGLNPTYSAAASADKFRPGPKTFLVVKNGNAGSVTVTVKDVKTARPAGAAAFDPDIEEVIEPGGERFIGPLPLGRFQGTSSNYGDILTSPFADVDIAVISA